MRRVFGVWCSAAAAEEEDADKGGSGAVKAGMILLAITKMPHSGSQSKYLVLLTSKNYRVRSAERDDRKGSSLVHAAIVFPLSSELANQLDTPVSAILALYASVITQNALLTKH